MKRPLLSTLVLAALVFSPACSRTPEVTPLQRKEAANLVSEAEFAATLRDLPRAEGLLAKAVELCPDNGEYWLTLGTIRRRADNRDGARKAYEQAVKAYAAAYKADRKNPQHLMQQVYVYSLLGQPKDAKKVLKQAHADHADNAGVVKFTEESLQRMTEEPAFKTLAL
jgi:tetratricopeptide (TPR) repeat protein